MQERTLSMHSTSAPTCLTPLSCRSSGRSFTYSSSCTTFAPLPLAAMATSSMRSAPSCCNRLSSNLSSFELRTRLVLLLCSLPPRCPPAAPPPNAVRPLCHIACDQIWGCLTQCPTALQLACARFPAAALRSSDGAPRCPQRPPLAAPPRCPHPLLLQNGAAALAARLLCCYGLMPHNASFGFLDLTPSLLLLRQFWD
jgi:hypothetical protein